MLKNCLSIICLLLFAVDCQGTVPDHCPNDSVLRNTVSHQSVSVLFPPLELRIAHTPGRDRGWGGDAYGGGGSGGCGCMIGCVAHGDIATKLQCQ